MLRDSNEAEKQMLSSLEEKNVTQRKGEEESRGEGRCKTNTLTVSKKNYLGFGRECCLPALLIILLGLEWRAVWGRQSLERQRDEAI